MPIDASVPGSIFTPAFLAALGNASSDDMPDAVQEAEFAGPWRLDESEHGWTVTAEGEAVPELLAASHDTALLVAALLPGLGRPRYLRLLETRGDRGYPLVGTDGGVLGYLTHFWPELAQSAHVIESLRRDPLSFSRLLAATRGPALQRAGQLLWLWSQAPRP